MAASQGALVTLRVVVCGGGRTWSWLSTLIREWQFGETRDALLVVWRSCGLRAQRCCCDWPWSFLRVLNGTNQVEQWQRPIMMEAREGRIFELGSMGVHVTLLPWRSTWGERGSARGEARWEQRRRDLGEGRESLEAGAATITSASLLQEGWVDGRAAREQDTAAVG